MKTKDENLHKDNLTDTIQEVNKERKKELNNQNNGLVASIMKVLEASILEQIESIVSKWTNFFNTEANLHLFHKLATDMKSKSPAIWSGFDIFSK